MERFDHGPVEFGDDDLVVGNDCGRRADRTIGEKDPFAKAVPVSYTHLRAHETVLDLVCRLLLEKKKAHQIHSFHTYVTTISLSQNTSPF